MELLVSCCDCFASVETPTNSHRAGSRGPRGEKKNNSLSLSIKELEFLYHPFRDQITAPSKLPKLNCLYTASYNTEALLIASKEIGLEVNAEKTKYMVMSRDQNAGQKGYIQTGNESFEAVEQFKYLGTTLTNQNSIHEEIKRRLKSGNACYHSVQNLLSSSLLSKNVKIKIY
jgi:hypothetical protein